MRISAYDNGVLLEQAGAYSLLHPWPTLGDETLEVYLSDLKAGAKLSLTKRALQILEIDRRAKANNELLTPTACPPSHHLLTLGEVPPENFSTLKLKIGKTPEEELRYIDLLNKHKYPFKLRLDCNQRFQKDAAMKFFSKLSEDILCRIDFVEDPMVGSEKDWEEFSKKFDLRIAHDFAPDSHRAVADVWILKPSRQDPWPLVERATHEMKRVVVTTALDHQLGVLVAAWEASRIAKLHPLLIDTCGLGAKMPSQSGVGFGLDKDLGNLHWEELR
jgi:O-succinylbenzoate synthase